MSEKKITILEYQDGKEVKVTRKMKASALLPRLYRKQFGRDIMYDMASLKTSYDRVLRGLANDATNEEKQVAQFSAVDLTVFEDLAWLMMKHAGEDVGDNPEEWLDRVAGMFTAYEIMPTVLNLWNDTQKTTAKPAKK